MRNGWTIKQNADTHTWRDAEGRLHLIERMFLRHCMNILRDMDKQGGIEHHSREWRMKQPTFLEQPKRRRTRLMLYVPTKGRVEHQLTLQTLPKHWLARTIVVCPAEEVEAHKRNWPGVWVLKQGAMVRSIASARAFIFGHADAMGYHKIVMLDDDIRFAARVKPFFEGIGSMNGSSWDLCVDADPALAKLRNIARGDPAIDKLLFGLEKMLDTYRHCGMHGRLNSNRQAYEWIANTRIQQVYAYHVPTVMKHCEIGVEIMRDDFDYEFQLLKKGFPCVVKTWTVGEQGRGFAAKGGQTSSRTMEINERDAYRLAKRHPGLVKVVKKPYGNGKRTRVEVICYWQKALLEGQLI